MYRCKLYLNWMRGIGGWGSELQRSCLKKGQFAPSYLHFTCCTDGAAQDCSSGRVWEVAYTEVYSRNEAPVCLCVRKKRRSAVSSGLIISDDFMELEIFLRQSRSTDLRGIFIGAEPSKLRQTGKLRSGQPVQHQTDLLGRTQNERK